MKPTTILHTLAGLAALILTASAHAELPVIQSIQVEATNLVVTAQVPPGHVRVVLESREGLRTGAWVPVAVQRGGGEGGTITFRLPRIAEFACFRVRADATEPLPASFYTGITSFDPKPVWLGQMLFNLNPTLGGGLTTFGNAGQAVLNDATSTASVPPRAVVESDIWRLDGDTLYIFNQSRGLQIIDVKHPDAARLRSTLSLPAFGEQMHLLPSHHVVLLTRPLCADSGGSEVLIVAVPRGEPKIVARLPVSGSITEGRLVGTALYVASETARPAGNTWERGTRVTSFDLALPNAPVQRSTLWYPGANHLVYATDTYFFVTSQYTPDGQPPKVNAIDITAPDGTMNARDSITVAGYVPDKFKLNWSGGVLSVISEIPGVSWLTMLETFRLPDPRLGPPSAAVKLGELELGSGERLHATRFDGTRAYVVTFRQIDPLWVVDLSDPTRPSVAGEIQVPGWSSYIHPMGNRLVTVGWETNRTTVSLFDVSNPALPVLLSRVPLGSGYSFSEAIYDEKAFTVLEDAGLILLPIQGTMTNSLQLIDLGTNSLTARGLIERDIAPRRATLHRDRIISFSATELFSVNATDRDHPQLSGRLELAWPVNYVFAVGRHLVEVTTDPPTVRVTPASDPNQVLTRLVFTNAPIVGATVRGNRLYLVQTRINYGYAIGQPDFFAPFFAQDLVLLPGVASLTNFPPASPISLIPWTPPPSLWLSIVDLSNLPTPRVLGEAVVAASPLNWPRLEPLWPRPDLLVWAVGAAGRLLAFDVSDSRAPAFLSDFSLAVNGATGFSEPFATDGLVYLSHLTFTPFAFPTTVALTNALLCDGCPTHWQRHYLDVVDYGDARQPTLRPPVNIPGPLQGISREGELLYTLGFHRISTNWQEGAEALDACAYDGVSAYLVDSLSLSNRSPHPVLVSGGKFFIGNVASPAVETWTLSNEGNFARLGGVNLSNDAAELVSFPGLLAVRLDGNRVEVFDDSNPAALHLVGDDSTSGCLGFTFRDVALGTRDLWLPLDAYGATSIKLSPRRF